MALRWRSLSYVAKLSFCIQCPNGFKIVPLISGVGILGTFRFLLALSVALSHFGTVWGYHIMNGRMAVQCFYMISGFLISLVLSHKYDPSTADGRRLFYSNRALRIFVPYWSFCVMILAVHVVIYFALGIRFGADAAFMQYWPEMMLLTRIYLLFSNILFSPRNGRCGSSIRAAPSSRCGIPTCTARTLARSK